MEEDVNFRNTNQRVQEINNIRTYRTQVTNLLNEFQGLERILNTTGQLLVNSSPQELSNNANFIHQVIFFEQTGERLNRLGNLLQRPGILQSQTQSQNGPRPQIRPSRPVNPQPISRVFIMEPRTSPSLGQRLSPLFGRPRLSEEEPLSFTGMGQSANSMRELPYSLVIEDYCFPAHKYGLLNSFLGGLKLKEVFEEDFLKEKTELIRTRLRRAVREKESSSIESYIRTELDSLISNFFPTFPLRAEAFDSLLEEFLGEVLQHQTISSKVKPE